MVGLMLFATAVSARANTPGPSSKPKPATFDLKAARRTSDLNATEIEGSRQIVEGTEVHEIRFQSRVWNENGSSKTVRIQAYVALPPQKGDQARKPGVIFAHGLGAKAEVSEAVEIARNLDVVALTLSAPGVAGSEGEAATPDHPQPLFACERDVRHSWLYGYAYAILRAVTYLGSRPDVDPEGIIVSGFSIGGVATYIANGVDDRIRGALPLASSGAMGMAAREETWMKSLLAAADLTADDRGPRACLRALDPLVFAKTQHGAIYMLVGAQDEFFPLDAVITTYEAIEAPSKRLAIMADYDHGWYFGGGCPARCMPSEQGPSKADDCPASCPKRCPPPAHPPYCGPQASYNRHPDFTARWALLLRALIANYAAHPRRPFDPPPEAPTIERRPMGLLVRPAKGSEIKAMRLAVSTNGGYTFGQFPLERAADGTYRFPNPVADDAIFFVEAEGKSGAVVTSVPLLPPGFQPKVRPFGPQP